MPPFIISQLPHLNCCFTHCLATNGVGVNLLKVGAKRRRTKQEIQDEKDEELAREQAIQDKMAMFDQMQQKISQLEQS